MREPLPVREANVGGDWKGRVVNLWKREWKGVAACVECQCGREEGGGARAAGAWMAWWICRGCGWRGGSVGGDGRRWSLGGG
jgi:hypothetical protein